jgi:hypothetical protein
MSSNYYFSRNFNSSDQPNKDSPIEKTIKDQTYSDSEWPLIKVQNVCVGSTVCLLL